MCVHWRATIPVPLWGGWRYVSAQTGFGQQGWFRPDLHPRLSRSLQRLSTYALRLDSPEQWKPPIRLFHSGNIFKREIIFSSISSKIRLIARKHLLFSLESLSYGLTLWNIFLLYFYSIISARNTFTCRPGKPFHPQCLSTSCCPQAWCVCLLKQSLKGPFS